MTASPLPLAGRIALVTGASRGIGRASALHLAAAGAHVVAVARTQGALEELDDEIKSIDREPATLVVMDLADHDGIDRLGRALFDRWGRLDILVHAAAMLGGLSPVSHVEVKTWDRCVDLNLTTPYRLIRSFEPLLKQSARPRALFLTSGRAIRPKAFWGPYAATKAGLEALVRCWAQEVEIVGIRAALVDPAAMRTRMRAEVAPGEDPATLPDPAEIGPMIVELADADLGLPTETHLFTTWKAARAANV
jgi:NAD(P)-dependent dehydrogenase (short-subunit alcohol dehydrogenase family)